MSGFKSPNHTQVPNELLDEYMREMELTELKVVLCIVRQTLGWHRVRTRFSIGNIERVTGLSRNGVMAGIDAAEKRGLLKRIPNLIPAEWELLWADTPSITDTPQPVRDTPSMNEGLPPQPVRGLKESKERSKENTTTTPNEEMLKVYGVGINEKTKRLALKENITPDIIKANAERLIQEKRFTPGLLITCLLNNDPVNLPREQDTSRYSDWAQ